MPSKYVNVAGLATNLLYAGPTTLPSEPPRYDRGRPLLFLHGAGGNAGHWRRQLELLGGQHSAIAPDFPGHGRSGGTEGLASVGAYAGFTADLAAAAKVPPTVVVGACMGASVALELALAQPKQVRALVLVNAAARPHFPAATVDQWREVTYGRAPQPFTMESFSPKTDFAVMRELWMEQVKTDPRVRYHDLLACNGYDATPRLASLRLPVLIVAGRDDALARVEALERLQQGIAGARLVVLDDAGHFAACEKAEAFAAAVEEFLASLPEAA